MKSDRYRLLFLLSVLMFMPCVSMGALVQVEGKWSDSKYAPTLTLAEHYDLGCKLLLENNWEEALRNFLIITTHFPSSPYYADSVFNSGVCYYHQAAFDLANRQFSKYLNLGGNLKHFEKVFEFKYYIAEYYSKGSKKHMFGIKQLPRVVPAKGDALVLYDEVIASLPNKEITVKSLYGKGNLLRAKKQYKESIEAFQTLTRRFPKHSLAADSFLVISEIYLEQSRIESQNPDLLALAQINLNRFQKGFPGDERIAQGETNLTKMKEAFAGSLYDTGRFYEKKKKPLASRIYYNEAIKRYPETAAAVKSRHRLAILLKEKNETQQEVARR